MKTLIALFLALTLCVRAFAAPLDYVQVATINASTYTAGAAAVKTIRVLSVDYEHGVVRFQLLDAGGLPYGNGGVFGLTDATITPANIEAKIVALISG
jgi:hypothetical protein